MEVHIFQLVHAVVIGFLFSIAFGSSSDIPPTESSKCYFASELRSSRPKSESSRPKFMVMSPDILSHVARNFIMLKKILKLLVRVKCETMKLRLFVSLSFSWR